MRVTTLWQAWLQNKDMVQLGKRRGLEDKFNRDRIRMGIAFCSGGGGRLHVDDDDRLR